MIAAEQDAMRTSRQGRSLADMMIANHAELAEELNPEAGGEVIEGDVACQHASCADAAGTVCECYGCLGTGHGWRYKARQEAARTAAATRTATVYGDAFGSLRVGGGLAEDLPVQRGGRGIAAITFDADGWPTD